MKTHIKLTNILIDHKIGIITLNEAENKISLLFDVTKPVCFLCDGTGVRSFPNCTPPVNEDCPACNVGSQRLVDKGISDLKAILEVCAEEGKTDCIWVRRSLITKDILMSKIEDHYKNERPLTPLKEFEIWMEGYSATGEHGYAERVGKGGGETFDDAVRDYMSKHPKHEITERGRDHYMTEEAYLNSRSKWTIWACCLFDNEADARKSFG